MNLLELLKYYHSELSCRGRDEANKSLNAASVIPAIRNAIVASFTDDGTPINSEGKTYRLRL